jgi:hypothetical protein
MRISITGTKGRIELEVVEKTTHPLPDTLHAEAFSGQKITMRAYPMFGSSYDIEVPTGEGSHGGGDPVMLDDIFLPQPPVDPFHRAASHLDGTASSLRGIAANESMRSGNTVYIDNLFMMQGKNRPASVDLVIGTLVRMANCCRGNTFRTSIQ